MAAEQFEPMPPKASSCYQRHMRINWREVCKFLSGAFFVSAGVLFYLYLTDTSQGPAGLSRMDGLSDARQSRREAWKAFTPHV